MSRGQAALRTAALPRAVRLAMPRSIAIAAAIRLRHRAPPPPADAARRRARTARCCCAPSCALQVLGEWR